MAKRSGKRFFVDIPDPVDYNQGGSCITVAEFDTRKEAVEFCAKMFGAVNGKMDLISEVDTLEGDEEDDSE